MNDDIRISYLILAHNCPNHFYRLINRLDDGGGRIFVHVDRKSDEACFKKNIDSKFVSFCTSRVAVYWGEFSQVEAILVLIKMALKEKSDYYVLISGSDYPIRSIGYIKKYLSINSGYEFINCVEIPNDDAGKPISRLENWKPDSRSYFDMLRSRSFIKRFVNKKRDYVAGLEGLTPFGGSTWWALTHQAVEYISSFIDRKQNVVNFFKNTHCPDEMFFQTIIGNSSFKGSIRGNLTYVDWSEGKPNPSLISLKHIEALCANSGNVMNSEIFGRREALFARKFPDDSKLLIEKIQLFNASTQQ